MKQKRVDGTTTNEKSVDGTTTMKQQQQNEK